MKKYLFGFVLLFIWFCLPVLNVQAAESCSVQCDSAASQKEISDMTIYCAAHPNSCSSDAIKLLQKSLQTCLSDCAAGKIIQGGFKSSASRLGAISGSYGVAQPKTLPQVIGGVINIILSLLGVIFLVLTIYGGYIWMIARGDDKEAERAKDIITNAVIGLILVLAAYAISFFVFSKLIAASGII